MCDFLWVKSPKQIFPTLLEVQFLCKAKKKIGITQQNVLPVTRGINPKCFRSNSFEQYDSLGMILFNVFFFKKISWWLWYCCICTKLLNKFNYITFILFIEFSSYKSVLSKIVIFRIHRNISGFFDQFPKIAIATMKLRWLKY